MIYGLPLEKKFPLNNPDEIIKAIYDFNKCHKVKRQILADNINKQLYEHDMMVKVPEDSDFINYIDDDHKAGVTSENKFTRICNSVCDIEYDGMLNDYNRKVFEHLVEKAKEIKDVNDYSSYLTTANEYADKMMQYNNVLPKEFTMSMDIVQNIIKSLTTSVLGFSPSEAYVKKLLEDLEELHILYSTSVWYMKRHLLYLNHLASRIGVKNDINKLIASKTNQLLNNETSLFNQLKLSKGRLNHMRDCDNTYFISYLKDKQMELKSYLDNQYSYFLQNGELGYRKGNYGVSESDEFIMLDFINSDIFDISKCTNSFLRKYPKLSSDIGNSMYFLLRTKYKKVKQVNINNSRLTILLLNKTPYVVFKKISEDNVLYLIHGYNLYDLPQSEYGGKVTIKAIKVSFNKKLYNDTMEHALEAATKF